MPGIVGVVTKAPRAGVEREVSRMVSAIRHEPSYSIGQWADESLGIYVGWAARKDSFADQMPLRNEDASVVLVFSGQEFPDPGTPARLRQRGHAVERDGPSYLVHLYEEDSSFPACLNGQFHGLLIDRAAGRATL